MIRALATISLAALLSIAAFGQPPENPPHFEIADVHVSARTANPSLRIGFTRGRYEIKTATMLDLVMTAYGVDASTVMGGPSWLETDRFDIIAKCPADATPETIKIMLRALLADRFNLVIHNDTRSVTAYVLTAGKRPLIKQSEGSGEGGCQDRPSDRSQVINAAWSCRNMTMAAFAETLQTTPLPPIRSYLAQNPVADLTGLKGAWDFNMKWTGRGLLASAGSDGITLFDAIDKQLGLKLELQKAPMPVLVVADVNEKPTDNLPGVTQKLPALPTEFEVADIKPSMPGTQENFRIQPGGRIDAKGISLKDLIGFAWNIDDENDDMLAGPKWMDTQRFDVVARVPAGDQLDDENLGLMLRKLLVERFKLATHFEDRPVAVYALVAANPKLKKADPSGRSGCRYAGAAPGGQASALLRTYVCQNATMTLFVESLHGLDPGYTDRPIVDASGVEGAWDFTLTMSGSRVFRNGGSQAAGSAASDPNGAVSLFEALEKQLGLKLETQKRPMPVLVIDRVEQNPTDN